MPSLATCHGPGLALLEADGSYDNSLATLDAFWAANDQLLRGAAWLVASPDGHKAREHPSPLAGVRSWTQVRAESQLAFGA